MPLNDPQMLPAYIREMAQMQELLPDRAGGARPYRGGNPRRHGSALYQFGNMDALPLGADIWPANQRFCPGRAAPGENPI